MKNNKVVVKKEKAKGGPQLTEGDLVYDREIGPIIEEVRARRGMTGEVVTQFNRIAGSPTHRNTVDGWLDPDPKTRVRPFYGNAIILFQAVAAARKVLDAGE